MSRWERHRCLIWMTLCTPIALFLGVFSAGAGHGSYLAAKLLFPLTMALAILSHVITWPLMVLAILQFPVYGWIVDSKRDWIWLLIGLHTILLMVCFAMPEF